MEFDIIKIYVYSVLSSIMLFLYCSSFSFFYLFPKAQKFSADQKCPSLWCIFHWHQAWHTSPCMKYSTKFQSKAQSMYLFVGTVPTRLSTLVIKVIKHQFRSTLCPLTDGRAPSTGRYEPLSTFFRRVVDTLPVLEKRPKVNDRVQDFKKWLMSPI